MSHGAWSGQPDRATGGVAVPAILPVGVKAFRGENALDLLGKTWFMLAIRGNEEQGLYVDLGSPSSAGSGRQEPGFLFCRNQKP